MSEFPPDTVIEVSTSAWPAGIAAQMGMRLLDDTGTTIVARISPLTEEPANSGRYVATFTTPHDPGQYTIMWDKGNVIGPTTTSYDDLTVAGGFITSEVLPGEILASLSDIQGNLDDSVAEVTSDNTAKIQISVARVVRGYLSRVIPTSVLVGWSTPPVTPQIIREIAGKFIAAQHYYNEISKSSQLIPNDHFAQKLYDEAMALLNGIIAGDIVVDDSIVVEDTSSLTMADFFPIDSTDRAFTLGMQL